MYGNWGGRASISVILILTDLASAIHIVYTSFGSFFFGGGGAAEGVDKCVVVFSLMFTLFIPNVGHHALFQCESFVTRGAVEGDGFRMSSLVFHPKGLGHKPLKIERNMLSNLSQCSY